jgi:ABC-type multidrug transport system ATPase subunit
VGYTSHQPLLYGKLTIQQNLEFFARLERVSPQRLHEKIALWRLADHRNKFVDQLSQGLKTRVALCRLFSGSADLLILDEPSAALDDEATQILITELATRINRGIGSNLAEAGVVITTHDTARILPCVDTIAVVHNGVLRGIGPKSEVKELLELYRSLNR